MTHAGSRRAEHSRGEGERYVRRPLLKVQSYKAEQQIWGTGAVWLCQCIKRGMLGGGAGRWEEPPAKFSGL